VSDGLSQRAVAKPVNWVRSLVCFIIGAIVYPALQNKGNTKAAKASHWNKNKASNGQGSAGAKGAGTVSLFPVIVVHIANPHVLLGRTGE